MSRTLITLVALAVTVAACGQADTGGTTTSEPETTTTAAGTTSTAEEGPALAPASVEFDGDESDGSTVTVDSVTLPSNGYLVIHADADGSPGPILGWSGLLEAGTHEGVTVTLEEPVSETQTVWPMAHIDVNQNGEYEFFPPDETTDAPAQTEGGDVAVVSGELTVAGAEEAGLTTAETDLGEILVDAEGRTLYIFTPDEQSEATCTGDCAVAWPPLLAGVEAGEGVDPELLGTVEHPEEGEMVTYNGWPLYYFANDAEPGDTNGQGVNDVWFVIGPDGEPITDAASASGPASDY